MSKCRVLMFIIVTIQLMSINGEQQKENQGDDGLCLTDSVLCVKDVLSNISKAARNVCQIVNETEGRMWKKEIYKDRLQKNINRIRKQILSYPRFPSSLRYEQFFRTNNIDRNDLVELFIEEHDTISYLYVSIKNLLAKRLHDHEFDELFDKTLYNLQHHMLCKYRNILHVYSEKWQADPPTDGIQLLQTRKRDLTLTDYRSYAIVIIELTRQWMKSIEYVINNLRNKLI